MFSIFKRNKKDDASEPTLIPITQRVEINEDMIIVYENERFIGSVNINIIDQIIFEHHGMYEKKRPNSWLSLRSKGQEMLAVSTISVNFKLLEQKLIQLTGFNATNFKELLQYDKPMKDVSIFRREIKESHESIVGNDIMYVDDSAFERASSSPEIATDEKSIPSNIDESAPISFDAEPTLLDMLQDNITNPEEVSKLSTIEVALDGDQEIQTQNLLDQIKLDIEKEFPLTSDISENTDTISEGFKPQKVEKVVIKEPKNPIDQFIIIEDRDCIIPWKNFSKIDRKFFHRELIQEDNKVAYKYKIEYIRLFHDVALPYLETKSIFAKVEANINEKFPVEEYYTEIHTNFVLDEFNKMTQKINTFFGLVGETFYSEDRLPVYTLKVNTVTIDIKTTATSIKLRIIKDIDVAAFYNKPYSRKLELDYVDTFRIPAKINITANYKNTSKIIFTPKCLEPLFESDNDTIFWIHKDESRIGMANNKIGVTFKHVKIIKLRLAIEMVDGVENKKRIEIIYKDGKKFSKISVKDTPEFIKNLPALMKFLKLPFTLYLYDKI